MKRLILVSILACSVKCFGASGGLSGSPLSGGGSGGGAGAATNVAYQVMTNFVLNTVYTNTSGGPMLISSLARVHTAAVNGDASIDLMVDQAGGVIFIPFAGIRMGTIVAVTLSMDYTNSVSTTISNLASYYWTNSSIGAGNVGALIAGTVSYTALGAVTNFVSSVTTSNFVSGGATSNQVIANPFGVNAFGSGSNYVAMFTAGKRLESGSSAPNAIRVGLWTSLDGTNWNKSITKDIYSPDSFTNTIVSFSGPTLQKWAIYFTNGYWWSVSPHDYQNTNGFAQGIDLWKSGDLTNWARETIMYPQGVTNSKGRIFSASWFRDTDQSAWVIYSYATNTVSSNSIWSVHLIDNTMTNWDVSNLIKKDDVTQEAIVVRANSLYYLFYRCRWPGLEYLRATNNSLTSLFVLAPDAAGVTIRGTNWGWGAFGNSGNAGGLSIINYIGSKWRAYLNDESSGSSTTMSYLDSTDDMTTWSSGWTTISTLTNYYGQGIAIAPAAATNQQFTIGFTNLGYTILQTPLVKASTVEAGDVRAEGIVTGGLFSRGSISTLNSLEGDSLYINAMGGLGGNLFIVNTPNVSFDLDGNGIINHVFTTDLTGLGGGLSDTLNILSPMNGGYFPLTNLSMLTISNAAVANQGTIQFTNAGASFPSNVVVGQSLSVAGGTGSNLGGSNFVTLLVITNFATVSNLLTIAAQPDFRQVTPLFITNATFVWATPTSFDTAGNDVNYTTITVTNNSNAALVMTGPANYNLVGTNGVNAGGVNEVRFKRIGNCISNWYSLQDR